MSRYETRHVSPIWRASSIDELTDLKREVTAARNVRYTTPADGHDDLVMALTYALWDLDRF